MSRYSMLLYVIGIAGALGAVFLLALLVGIALGADALGATVALLLFLPAWVGFGYFFLRQRELKGLLERVLLTLSLEAFALPIAALLFGLLLLVSEFDPVGEQTVVMGHAAGLFLGALGVFLFAGLVTLAVGGLSFLLYLLLKFNLVHVGRAVKLEAERRMKETPALIVFLIGSSTFLLLGASAAQMPSQPPSGISSGVWTEPFYCPCLRAALFINHAERGALAALLRLERLTSRLLGEGWIREREEPSLRAARQRLESYVFATGNPNLRVGDLRDLGEEVEGEITTHTQELVERLRVDKRTGALWAVQ